MKKRDRTKISIAAGAVLFLVGAFVTASSQMTSPLYTIRMEQASNEMNFLPTAVNDFTYSTEKGYSLTYGVAGCCVIPIALTEEIPCKVPCKVRVYLRHVRGNMREYVQPYM